MLTKVLVPRLGEGVEEVTVTKWLKQVGDSIDELEPLLEVNTDKVDSEIPSPVAGIILSIEFEEGTAVRVGEVLAMIGQMGDTPDDLKHPDEKTIPSESTLPTLPAESNPVTNPEMPKYLGFISPVVAKMAAELGLNLQQIEGTGLGGRITKNDIQAYVQDRGRTATQEPPKPTTQPANPATQTLPDNDKLIKHSLMRKSIAEHMLASKRTSPHVLTVMEVDMTRVSSHRAANKNTFARDGANLTYTAYFMAAIVAGLKAFPLSNSSWSDDGVLIHAGIHLGMATSLGEDGLIVPVIKNADGLSLLGMARVVNDLAARARGKKLHPDEVRGGTFTLTNHGVSGSLFAMPIINQPQCGILGAGAMQKRAVVVTDEFGSDAIAVRLMVYLSYVFDHRILDGASADWFLAKVKETLENWNNQ